MFQQLQIKIHRSCQLYLRTIFTFCSYSYSKKLKLTVYPQDYKNMSTEGKRHQLKDRNSFHISPFWKYPTVIKRSDNSDLKKNRTKHIHTHIWNYMIKRTPHEDVLPRIFPVSYPVQRIQLMTLAVQNSPTQLYLRTAHQSNGSDGTAKPFRQVRKRRNCYMFWKNSGFFSVYCPTREGKIRKNTDIL